VKLLALLLLSTAAAAQAPDTILFHGDILTGAHLRADDTAATPARVSAIAITAGKISALGTDAKILALADPHTQKIDLHGAFAMPGFNDAHTHIASAGQQKLSVDLDNIPSLAAMQAKVKGYAGNVPEGNWITGGGWDHTKWSSGKLPTKEDLDAVTGNHPAFLERTDGHIVVVNTAALKAANITAATKSPIGGQIDLDPATHEPTGIIRDAAVHLIRSCIPPPDGATRRHALTIALADASAHGVTSVQDLSDWDDFLVLEQMERDGQLHVRVSSWLTFADPVATLAAHRDHHPATDAMLHTGMLKGFMDGSLGSRTAAMQAPYSDEPSNYGLPRYSQKVLDQMTTERGAAGFQIGFHAIGDRANSMALTAFEVEKTERMKALEKLLPQLEASAHSHIVATDAARFRIEHAQVLLPGDFLRFDRLHIIASMQPSHLLTDMAWATDRIGPERAKYAYAWRSFLDHHITLAFGTDYPVESVSPFRGLYSAITRQNEAGTQTFHPEQKLTINEAIYAYTQGSAFAENMEHQKGRLEPNFLADIVVLDRDITKTSPQDVLHTRVLRTIVGGATVYEAPPTAALEPTHHRLPDAD